MPKKPATTTTAAVAMASEKMQTRAAANTINFLYHRNESGQESQQRLSTVPMRSWVARMAIAVRQLATIRGWSRQHGATCNRHMQLVASRGNQNKFVA